MTAESNCSVNKCLSGHLKWGEAGVAQATEQGRWVPELSRGTGRR